MIRKTAMVMTILVILLGASNVYAVVGSGDMLDNKDMIIVPFWENAKEVKPTILFTDGIYSGSIRGSSDVTKISMTVLSKLQFNIRNNMN